MRLTVGALTYAVVVLTYVTVAYSYSFYYFPNSDCSGIPKESAFIDGGDCTSFMSAPTKSIKGTCSSDDNSITFSQWASSGTCAGATSDSTFTVNAGVCQDMTSAWGGGSVMAFCKAVPKLTYVTYLSNDCSGSSQSSVDVPAKGCSNTHHVGTPSYDLSVYAECLNNKPTNVRMYNHLYCSGSSTGLPQDISNGACVDTTSAIGGGSFKAKCTSGALGVTASIMLFITALVVTARNVVQW
jgi:hypothetical protein